MIIKKCRCMLCRSLEQRDNMCLLSFSPLSLWLSLGTWWLASLLLFGLSLYSCMVVCTEVEGWYRVISSSQRIVSTLGDDVILPCHVEPQIRVETMIVEWWKSDVLIYSGDPLRNYKYAHAYLENQRAVLLPDGLKHGNISLKIINVTQSDQGEYRCQIPHLNSYSLTKLVVETPLPPTVNHQTPDPNDGSDVEGDGSDVKGGRHHLIVLVPVLVLILGGGVAGYLLRHKCQKQNYTKYDVQSQVDKLDQQHNGYR